MTSRVADDDVYKQAVTLSEEDGGLLYNAKKNYEYQCRRSKNVLNNARCHKMNEMRRRSPREFWRLFKSSYSGSVGDTMSNKDFKNYFSELMAGGETSDDEFSDFVNQFDADSVQLLIHWTPPYQTVRSCGPLRRWVQIRSLLLTMFYMSTSKSLFQ